ncbi:MAG: hypothetical protein N2738_02725 [Thermodesulfovibrionales bacterium]|nr:hypothetical protein [Thermodesulfovibrionales bacterium]
MAIATPYLKEKISKTFPEYQSTALFEIVDTVDDKVKTNDLREIKEDKKV